MGNICFVGLGGTGIHVMVEMREYLESTYYKDDPKYDTAKQNGALALRFCGIDFDQQQNADAKVRALLNAAECLFLPDDLTRTQGRLQQVVAADHRLKTALETFLPLSDPVVNQPQPGAGQVRAYGKALFTHHAATSNLLGPLDRLSAVVPGSYPQFHFAGNLYFLIASLAGGTGAGTTLDVANYLRSRDPNAHILLFLLSPQYFTAAGVNINDRIWANYYRFIQDLFNVSKSGVFRKRYHYGPNQLALSLGHQNHVFFFGPGIGNETSNVPDDGFAIMAKNLLLLTLGALEAPVGSPAPSLFNGLFAMPPGLAPAQVAASQVHTMAGNLAALPRLGDVRAFLDAFAMTRVFDDTEAPTLAPEQEEHVAERYAQLEAASRQAAESRAKETLAGARPGVEDFFATRWDSAYEAEASGDGDDDSCQEAANAIVERYCDDIAPGKPVWAIDSARGIWPLANGLNLAETWSLFFKDDPFHLTRADRVLEILRERSAGRTDEEKARTSERLQQRKAALAAKLRSEMETCKASKADAAGVENFKTATRNWLAAQLKEDAVLVRETVNLVMDALSAGAHQAVLDLELRVGWADRALADHATRSRESYADTYEKSRSSYLDFSWQPLFDADMTEYRAALVEDTCAELTSASAVLETADWGRKRLDVCGGLSASLDEAGVAQLLHSTMERTVASSLGGFTATNPELFELVDAPLFRLGAPRDKMADSFFRRARESVCRGEAQAPRKIYPLVSRALQRRLKPVLEENGFPDLKSFYEQVIGAQDYACQPEMVSSILHDNEMGMIGFRLFQTFSALPEILTAERHATDREVRGYQGEKDALFAYDPLLADDLYAVPLSILHTMAKCRFCDEDLTRLVPRRCVGSGLRCPNPGCNEWIDVWCGNLDCLEYFPNGINNSREGAPRTYLKNEAPRCPNPSCGGYRVGFKKDMHGKWIPPWRDTGVRTGFVMDKCPGCQASLPRDIELLTDGIDLPAGQTSAPELGYFVDLKQGRIAGFDRTGRHLQAGCERHLVPFCYRDAADAASMHELEKTSVQLPQPLKHAKIRPPFDRTTVRWRCGIPHPGHGHAPYEYFTCAVCGMAVALEDVRNLSPHATVAPSTDCPRCGEELFYCLHNHLRGRGGRGRETGWLLGPRGTGGSCVVCNLKLVPLSSMPQLQVTQTAADQEFCLVCTVTKGVLAAYTWTIEPSAAAKVAVLGQARADWEAGVLVCTQCSSDFASTRQAFAAHFLLRDAASGADEDVTPYV